MSKVEPTCELNLRKFPRGLRKRLRHYALDSEEDVQDFVPLWLRERLEKEEKRLEARKKDAKAE